MACGPGKGFFSSTNFFVYLSHCLSAWGDRMWAFGIGIFLINISPESLQLTAASGLSRGISVLLFGALIGDIVDVSPRLKAAQVALVLQNAFVILNVAVIYIYLKYSADILSVGLWIKYVIYAIIIIFSILSQLSSIARSIAVEKDWIVEICGGDSDKLATMTASLRRIDLSTKVLAPVATGLIMTFAGVEFGALFIGGWNLVSVVIEYYFLWKVYNTVPALRRKKNLKRSEVLALAAGDTTDQEIKDVVQAGSAEVPQQFSETEETPDSPEADNEDGAPTPLMEQSKAERNAQSKEEKDSEEQTKNGCRCSIFNSLQRLYKGWPIYIGYDVVHAGIALSCLYMTVLGFDNVTVGYAKMQGMTEGHIGGLMSVSAVVGIVGTFLYPIMRRKLGLPRTGIFGLSFEILCLTLCIASVWIPDSPFDLSKGFHYSTPDSGLNCTADQSNNTDVFYITSDGNNSTIDYGNYSLAVTTPVMINETSTPCSPLSVNPRPSVSVWMLMAGIVTARFGLWVADLAITQLFLERVEEAERGKVNGVQSSLNQLMDMLKFLMVVLAPYEHQFGLLVIISFVFICIGWLFYAYFLKKNRGHLFHFEKCLIGCGNGAAPSNGNV
ncbi:solute carrier family 40 member 1 [Aplysia californica]|uniref:Solute carrier family 40 member n=1 Tax=Aplysia californica TaxID=6500 RepID=A0ABM0JHT6_APLCA|nr:solute carrier family 40 member 1 [Aplysia californica]